MIMFQFQNGAIVRPSANENIFLFIKFQFQNGAIVSKATNWDYPFTYLFQFQNGAIVRNLKIGITLLLICFNSKMVRL